MWRSFHKCRNITFQKWSRNQLWLSYRIFYTGHCFILRHLPLFLPGVVRPRPLIASMFNPKISPLSISDHKSYALSIRDWDESKKDVAIKHYRIRKMDNGGCYISPKKTFSSILDLVEHYKRKYFSVPFLGKMIQPNFCMETSLLAFCSGHINKAVKHSLLSKPH